MPGPAFVRLPEPEIAPFRTRFVEALSTWIVPPPFTVTLRFVAGAGSKPAYSRAPPSKIRLPPAPEGY